VGAKLISDITMPVWSHIQVDWGKLKFYDVEPVSIPDLFAAKPIIIYGKYKGKPSGTITLKGKTATGNFELTIQTDKAEITQSEALCYLWARNRIKYLSDYASYFEDGVEFIYQNETPKHQQEITELGLKYNLLTKYTSFLAVNDERQRIDLSSINLSPNPGRKRGCKYLRNPLKKMPQDEIVLCPASEHAIKIWIEIHLQYPKHYVIVSDTIVLVEFTVDQKGHVANVKVVNSVHPLLDANAIEVISRLPDWIFGKQPGKQGIMQITFPVVFKANKSVKLG
jgi:Ca-activated chloride channel family protein